MAFLFFNHMAKKSMSKMRAVGAKLGIKMPKAKAVKKMGKMSMMK